MHLKPIHSFGHLGEQLTFNHQPISIEENKAPAAQFEFGDKYILLVPGDIYALELFNIYILDRNLRTLEYHCMPDKEGAVTAAPRVSVHTDTSLLIDSGSGSRWIVEFSPKRCYRPLDAYRRMASDWTPLFEYKFLIWGSYLRAHKAENEATPQ